MAQITYTSPTTGRKYRCNTQHLHLLANSACVEIQAEVVDIPDDLLATRTVEVSVNDLSPTNKQVIAAGIAALLAEAVQNYEEDTP